MLVHQRHLAAAAAPAVSVLHKAGLEDEHLPPAITLVGTDNKIILTLLAQASYLYHY